MTGPERKANALFVLALILTFVVAASGRPVSQCLVMTGVVLAAAVWSLTATVRAHSRRQAQAIASLRQIHLYTHGAGPHRETAPLSDLTRRLAERTLTDTRPGVDR